MTTPSVPTVPSTAVADQPTSSDDVGEAPSKNETNLEPGLDHACFVGGADDLDGADEQVGAADDLDDADDLDGADAQGGDGADDEDDDEKPVFDGHIPPPMAIKEPFYYPTVNAYGVNNPFPLKAGIPWETPEQRQEIVLAVIDWSLEVDLEQLGPPGILSDDGAFYAATALLRNETIEMVKRMHPNNKDGVREYVRRPLDFRIMQVLVTFKQGRTFDQIQGYTHKANALQLSQALQRLVQNKFLIVEHNKYVIPNENFFATFKKRHAKGPEGEVATKDVADIIPVSKTVAMDRINDASFNKIYDDAKKKFKRTMLERKETKRASA